MVLGNYVCDILPTGGKPAGASTCVTPSSQTLSLSWSRLPTLLATPRALDRKSAESRLRLPGAAPPKEPNTDRLHPSPLVQVGWCLRSTETDLSETAKEGKPESRKEHCKRSLGKSTAAETLGYNFRGKDTWAECSECLVLSC